MARVSIAKGGHLYNSKEGERSFMNSLLFLGVGATVMLLMAAKDNAKVKNVLKRHSSATWYLPRTISMLIVAAQVSELAKIVEHVSIVHIVAALFLVSILAATKSGTESETR